MSRLRTSAMSHESSESLVRRFCRFCVVGGSGLIVDMVLLYALAGAGLVRSSLLLSKACAAEVAMVNNFIWNEFWTFRGLAAPWASASALFKRFGKFNAICSGGILISALALKFFVHGLGMNLFFGNLFAIMTATFWNFGLNYAFTWRAGRA